MSFGPRFLRSLLVAAVVGFVLPVVAIAIVLGSLDLLHCLVRLDGFIEPLRREVVGVLAVFGSGHPLQGIAIIGLTCGLVGMLFDTFAFYQYQDCRDRG